VQVDYILAQKQPTITSSTNITIGCLTALTNVITQVVRTTDIEFSDVAYSGDMLLSIKFGTTTFYVSCSISRYQTFHILRLQQQLCV
ncbi:MAG: hypothetical protein ACKPKO_51385, partial [Candidatus Fonsibacter sp.]